MPNKKTKVKVIKEKPPVVVSADQEHLKNEKTWFNESGQAVPIQYVSKTQKLMERHALAIVREARRANNLLVTLKQYIAGISDKIFLAVMKEREIDLEKRKRNFIWFNFNRSIKIEVVDQEAAKFDDMLVTAATEKLMSFLNKTLDIQTQFIKDLILDALRSRNGKLDYKKIFTLLKYKDKIKDPLFKSAMDDLEEAYRLVGTKIYYRIWEKDETGEYKIIDLNFSNILLPNQEKK